MVKPEPWENPMLDTMWHFMEMGGLKANYPALKEACMEMRQMIMQKTAGQRKDRPKDIPWENWERVKVTIICEAMALVLSGEYEPKEEKKNGTETAVVFLRVFVLHEKVDKSEINWRQGEKPMYAAALIHGYQRRGKNIGTMTHGTFDLNFCPVCGTKLEEE